MFNVFIDIAKKQARRKRKQDDYSKNDSLHDDKVASEARTSSIATKSAKKKATSKKIIQGKYWCIIFSYFIFQVTVLSLFLSTNPLSSFVIGEVGSESSAKASRKGVDKGKEFCYIRFQCFLYSLIVIF